MKVKKFLFITLALVIFILNCSYSQVIKSVNSQPQGKDLIKFQKIKSKTKFKNGITIYHEEYDTSGKRTFVADYTDSGKFERSFTYFNSEKNLYFERYLEKDNKGEAMHIRNYRFDTSGITNTKYIYDSSMNLTGRVIETKDSVNGIYKYEEYDEDSNLFLSREYKYDKAKRKTEYKHFMVFFGSNINFKIIYKYDDDGNNIENDRYEGINGYFYSIKLNSYSLGKLTESHEYMYLKFSSKEYYYKYDENENLIELTAYKDDGSIDHSTSFKYDNNNNPVEEKYSDVDNKKNYLETYKYEYYK